MHTGKYYWDRKINKTQEFFKQRPAWMKNFDNDFPSAAFIKGLIEEYRPSEMLEIGTAAGWAAYYMLEEAKKHKEQAKLTSVDLFDSVYYLPERQVGSAFKETNPALAKEWELITKVYPVDFLSQTNKKFDFVFIDANHQHPWASLDFLAVLPTLKDGAVVVFHDVMLNQITQGLKNPGRHPDGIVSYKNESKGPNALYQAFQEEMTISYDTVCENCAAIEVKTKDLNKIFEKILCALKTDWETDCILSSLRKAKEFLAVLKKHTNVIHNFFGNEYSEKFQDTFPKKFREEYSKIEKNFIKTNQEKINKLPKNKRIFFWGASLFAEDLISLNIVSGEYIKGIIDKNLDKAGCFLGEIPIYSPENLKELRPEIIVPAAINHPILADIIEDECKKQSIKADIINLFS